MRQYDARQGREARKDAATLRIKEKVAVLEEWHKEGVPENYEWYEEGKPDKKYGCPKSLAEFQKWSDQDLKVEVRLDGEKQTVEGVYKVGAPAMDKPERSGLKKHALELLEAIKKKPSDKKELTRLKADKQALDALTQQLVNETAQLRYKIIELQSGLDLAKVTNKNLLVMVAMLEAEVRTVRPFEPRLTGNRGDDV
ncbi:hypothetical protein [Geoanaerobacter pelophilus]|nr:hypothetical protein [Geoanaerobacter pelophilus]